MEEHKSTLAHLPADLLGVVTFYLHFDDRISLLSSCHILKTILEQEKMWSKSVREFWDISKLPASYIEYIRNRRARRLLNVREIFSSRYSMMPPLPFCNHIMIDLYEDLAYYHKDLMDKVFRAKAKDESKDFDSFTDIAVEITRRYPFMALVNGYGSYIKYCATWEVKAYGREPYEGYVEPPDAGYNSARVSMGVARPENLDGWKEKYPECPFDESFATPSKNEVYLYTIYAYDNDYDGGWWYNRDTPHIEITKFLSVTQFVESIDQILQRLYIRIAFNIHMSSSGDIIHRQYWITRLEKYVAELQQLRFSAGRLISEFPSQKLYDIYTSTLNHQKSVEILDSICFDPAPISAHRSRPSKAPKAAALRCAVRCSRYLLLPSLSVAFDPRYNTLEQNLESPMDVFIRGTTTETNWRIHYTFEKGVRLERQLCARRLKTGLGAISIRQPEKDLWPLWTVEAIGRLLPDIVKLCLLSAAIRADPNDSEQIKIELDLLLKDHVHRFIHEFDISNTRLIGCLEILGLNSLGKA